jgi:hypothetical protein
VLKVSYAEFWYRPMAIEEDVYRAIDADVEKLTNVWKEKRIKVSRLTAFVSNQGETPHETEGIVVEGSKETFIFPKVIPESFKQIYVTMKDGRIFQFVSTGRDRYNLAIQAILIIAKQHLKEQLIVTSNGYQHEWGFAIDLVKEHLGYGEDFTLDESPTFEEMGIKWTVYRSGEEANVSEETSGLPDIDKDVEEINPKRIKEMVKEHYSQEADERKKKG